MHAQYNSGKSLAYGLLRNAAVLFSPLLFLSILVRSQSDFPTSPTSAGINQIQLASLLNAKELPGVRFYPETFPPSANKYAGQSCRGIHIVVTNREKLRPVHVGLEIAAALHQLHGDRFKIDRASHLFGSREDLRRIRAGEDPSALADGWVAGESEWRSHRKPYLLY